MGFFYNLTYFFFVSIDQSLEPFTTKNKNPAAKPRFLKKAMICICSEKSVWKITAVAIVNMHNNEADNFVLYPIMRKIGKIISNTIVGHNKKPGTP